MSFVPVYKIRLGSHSEDSQVCADGSINNIHPRNLSFWYRHDLQTRLVQTKPTPGHRLILLNWDALSCSLSNL